MRSALACLAALLTLAIDVTPAAALRAVERLPQAEKKQPHLELLYARPPSEKPNVVLNGDVLKNPITLSFNVVGDIKIVPAGDDTPGTGHFHLLIDSPITPEEMKTAIPTDAQHIHYGKGQTEATLTLPPGKHTLQLLLGDGNHVPHDLPILSQPVTVMVE